MEGSRHCHRQLRASSCRSVGRSLNIDQSYMFIASALFGIGMQTQDTDPSKKNSCNPDRSITHAECLTYSARHNQRVVVGSGLCLKCQIFELKSGPDPITETFPENAKEGECRDLRSVLSATDKPGTSLCDRV